MPEHIAYAVPSSEVQFEFRVRNDNIHPDTLPMQDLGKMLINLQISLSAIAQEQNPDLKPEEFVVGLAEVQEGSARFKFASPIREAAIAFAIVTTAISSGQFDALPKRALDGLNEIVKFSKSRQWDFEFYRGRSDHAPDAEIRAVDPPDLFGNQLVQGETDLYGLLLRVGGAEPKLALRLEDGTIFSCDCHRDFAKQLASRLYETVGLHGRAKWHPVTLELMQFRAEDVLPYEETDIVAAVDRLREAVHGAYDDLDDVEAFIEELRGVS